MTPEKIDINIQKAAFDFFYWFSRFEFALKRNCYLEKQEVGATAVPSWTAFVRKWHRDYSPSREATGLFLARPARQIISSSGGDLDWKEVGLEDCRDELSKVVRVLKTVRNNLFHGGKHTVEGWDDPARTLKLLRLSLAVLEELAELGDIVADYHRAY